MSSVFSNQESEAVDCSTVDVRTLEEISDNLTSYLVNIDVTNTQFDVDLMLEQANKLGLDFGDL